MSHTSPLGRFAPAVGGQFYSAGIGFVACTRVRHPWDLVFEEDLPEYEHFMKARRTPAFRARRRFELRQEARASRTLRRYGYCEADLWTASQADRLREVKQGHRGGVGNGGRPRPSGGGGR